MTRPNLQDWLLEQITSDEQLARAELGDYAGSDRPTESRHQAAWPPDRVIIECWTKRRIIDLAIDAMQAARGSTRFLAAEEFMQTTMMVMAEPYADRPGYRDDWRP